MRFIAIKQNKVFGYVILSFFTKFLIMLNTVFQYNIDYVNHIHQTNRIYASLNILFKP